MDFIEHQDGSPPRMARRAHKKSRTGCIHCKTRKVKCDETKPSCRNCKIRGLQCAYTQASSKTPEADLSVVVRTESAEAVSSSSTLDDAPAGTSLATPLASDPDLSMVQLELLHHFTTSTCLTISRDPLRQTIWRINVVQVGFSYSFVMRTILTMSAYHLAYYRPSQRDFYTLQATILYEPALRHAASLLPLISDENCNGLYLFSALTCLISCAKPRRPDDLLFIEESGISEWLRLFRGNRSILDHTTSQLHTGPLSAMFSLGRRRALRRSSMSTNGHDFLQKLRHLIRNTAVDPAIIDTYESAIDELAKSFCIIQEITDCESSDVFVWLFEVSDDFLTLLSDRQPEALAIFGHYCVILKQLEWAWWMEGWSTHLLSNIYHALDNNFKLWIQWPIEQLGWIPN